MSGTWSVTWYDALYGNDPATDNIFGREDLAERRTPLLHAFLASGGRLADFQPVQDEDAARLRLIAAIDRTLADFPPQTS